MIDAPPVPTSQPAGWVTIVVSWIGSGFLSAIVAGFYNVWATRNQYENDYYKTVISRRLLAYEKVELLIVWLKGAVLDTDGKPYHVVFSDTSQEGWKRPWGLVTDLLNHGLWLSDEVFKKARELSDLMFHLDRENPIEFGKRHYETIAKIRADLERLLARDLLKLHDVKGFLKAKNKPDEGFREFNPK